MLTRPGDNLNDFTVAFEEKPIADEFTKVDNAEAEWGERFSVLFKATCGEWKNTFYNYGRSPCAEGKVEAAKSAVADLNDWSATAQVLLLTLQPHSCFERFLNHTKINGCLLFVGDDV